VITATNTELLIGLADPQNRAVWQTFYDRYRPLLTTFAKRLGLKEVDAEDAAQEALIAFMTSYQQGRYDREKGRLRTWLSAIARNKIHDIQQRRYREAAAGAGDSSVDPLEQIADDRSMSEIWEAEWQRAVLRQCRAEVEQQVDAKTMKAFDLLVVEGKKAGDVAAELGMTRNAVYLAKSHVLDRMQKVQKDLEENW
jgi:RNA polymerase sigma-70 factor (ECF subfamily)